MEIVLSELKSIIAAQQTVNFDLWPDEISHFFIEDWVNLIEAAHITRHEARHEIHLSLTLCVPDTADEDQTIEVQWLLGYIVDLAAHQLIEHYFADQTHNTPIQRPTLLTKVEHKVATNSEQTIYFSILERPKTRFETAVMLGRGIRFFETIIERPRLDYFLIELMFEETEDYGKLYARTHATATDNRKPVKPILVAGPPMSGKTYACLRLLYGLSVLDNKLVWFIDDMADLLDDFDRFCDGLDYFQKFHPEQLPVTVYFDDPFGKVSFSEEYDLNDFNAGMNCINKLCDDKRVRFIATSRREVYAAARRTLSTGDFKFINNFEVVYFDEQPSDETLLNVVTTQAWIRDAHWGDNLKDTLLKARKLDGSMFASRLLGFVGVTLDLHPDLAGYPKTKEPHIRVDFLRRFFARPDYISFVFESELDNSISKSPNPKVPTAFLLPAITEIMTKDWKKLFPPKGEADLEEDPEYLRFISYYDFDNSNVDKVIRYKSEPFAIAAHNLLRKEGRDLIEKYLFDYLSSKGAPKTVFEDVCAIYVCLGGDETLCTTLAPGGAANAEWDSLKLLSHFFGETAHDAPIVLNHLDQMSGDDDELAKVASLTEQQLFELGSRNYEKFKESLLRISDASRVAHSSYLDDEANLVSIVQLSLLLHSSLSHVERLLTARDPDNDSSSDEDDIKIIRNLCQVDLIQSAMLKNNLSERELRYLVIWIDALLMKAGELYKYCDDRSPYTLEEIKLEQIKNVSDHIIEWVMEILNGLDNVTTREKSQKTNLNFVSDAIYFTMIWHKCMRQELSSVLDFLSKNWRAGTDINPGFLYNVRYHANYFDHRRNSWAKENRIRFFHTGGPRRGATQHHETGLSYAEVGEDFRQHVAALLAQMKEWILNESIEVSHRTDLARILALRCLDDRSGDMQKLATELRTEKKSNQIIEQAFAWAEKISSEVS